MNKKLVISLCAFTFILLAGFALRQERGDESLSDAMTGESLTTSTTTNADPKNIAYTIDGHVVALRDGQAETTDIPDSAARRTTRYFGNELVTDLDGDGDEDVVFILTQDGGGSGTFYYAVAALKTGTGYVGSDGYLLGDRIAPQSTNLSQNPDQRYVVVFNYADRAPGEPFTIAPQIGMSVYLKIVPETKQWAIVEPDFEGESTY